MSKQVSYFDVLGEKIEIADLVARKKATRCFILVGDSYGESPSVAKSWREYAKTFSGLGSNRVYATNISGGSFGNAVKYLTALKNITGIDDNTKITDIIVCGGYNELNMLSASIYAGITEFCNYAKETYPNARVHIGLIGLTTNPDYERELTTKVLTDYRNANEISNGDFIEGSQFIFRRYDHLGFDGIHPTEYGSLTIGRAIANYMTNGTIIPADTNGYVPSVHAQWGVTVDGNFGLNWTEYFDGKDVTLVNNDYKTITFGAPTTVNNKVLASFLDTALMVRGLGNATNLGSFTSISVDAFGVKSDASRESISLTITFVDKYIYLSSNSDTQFESIIVAPFSRSIPVLMC